MSDLLDGLDAPKTYDRTQAPTSCPWGQIDHKREEAPGIWSVQTPGHGGYKLSAQRNRDMPAYMRRPGGAYEEDCDWALVALVFPDTFKVPRPWHKPGEPTDYEHALLTVKNWQPDAYEKFFGVTVTAAESHVRRQQQFKVAHAGDYQGVAAWGDWAFFVPAGMVGVCAMLGGRLGPGTTKWFLVPQADYHGTHFIADLAKHQEIPEPPQNARSSKTEG